MIKLRFIAATGVILICMSAGCGSLVSTAITAPFQVAREAQELAFAQIEGSIKIVDGTISVVDHISDAAHRHALRKAERMRKGER